MRYNAPPTSRGSRSRRLSDDVLAVLDGLRIESAILICHSIAGLEMSLLAAQHPERIGGAGSSGEAELRNRYQEEPAGRVGAWRGAPNEWEELSVSNFVVDGCRF